MEGTGQSSTSEQKLGRFKRVCVFCGSKAGYKSTYAEATVELGKVLVEKKIDLVYGGGSVGLMGLISKTVFSGGSHVLGVIPKALLPHEISGETVGEVKTVADMHQRKSEMAKHADAFVALPGGYGTMEELLEMITWAQLGIHDKPVRYGFVLTTFWKKKEYLNKYDGFFSTSLLYFLGLFKILKVSLKPSNKKQQTEMLSEWLIVNLTFYRFRKMYNQVGLLNVDGYYDGLLALFDKGVEEGFIDNSARKIVVIANMADELIKRMEEYVAVHNKVAPRQRWEVDQLSESTQSGQSMKS